MPNSPPTASVTPVRSALKLESTNRRVANAAITALMSTMATSSARMSQNSRHSALKSSSMPTEMKNRPSRMSRNGRMTLSTWWLYSVSASIIPARNAPSAIDRPAICEAQADGQRHQQHREREQLAQAAVGDDVQQRAQQPASGGQHHEHRGDARGHELERVGHGEGFAARRQRRGQREERHHGDVLEQHDAEGEPAVRAVELGAFGEPLHDEHRGAHGHHAAEHDALRPVEAERVRDQRDHRGGAEHLQRSQAEHLAAQRHHARPGEFQAQREQQEHHAELGQQVRGVGFGEQRRWRAAPAPGRP